MTFDTTDGSTNLTRSSGGTPLALIAILLSGER